MQEAAAACRLTEADLDDWEQFIAKGHLIEALWNLSVGVAGNNATSDGLEESLTNLFSDVHADRISKLQQLRRLELILTAMDVAAMNHSADAGPHMVSTAHVVFLALFLLWQLPKNGQR